MRGLYRLLAGLASRIGSDRRGTVLMLFAFSIIPIIGAVGCAIDYSQAARSRTRITQAANVAALAAARVAQNYLNMSGTGTVQFAAAKQLAQIEMALVFAANQPNDAFAKDVVPTLTMTQASDGSAIATVTAAGVAPTSFMRIVGIPTVAINALAEARGGAPKYYQIVFVVDISNSMGIGGTSADIASLTNDKQIQCAFACHDVNNRRPDSYTAWCKTYPNDANCHTTGPLYCPPLSYWGSGRTATNNYNAACTKREDTSTPYADKRALAKKYGYKLKIDYINDAITAFIGKLEPYMVKAPNLFRVSIFPFGTTASTTPMFPTSATVSPVNALTMPLYVQQLKTAAQGIDLETAVTSAENYGYTYTTLALQRALAGTSGVIGDGSSATKRKTYFILLSDGAEDTPGGSWGRHVSVDYRSACMLLKQPVDASNSYSNPVIFSIEAAYPPVPDDQYNVLIRSTGMDTAIPDTMKGCATSSSDYFLANDGPAIQSAVGQIFSNIVGSNLHLSR